MPGDDFEDDYTPDGLVAGSGDEIDGPFIPLEGEEEVLAAGEDVNNGGASIVQAQESAKKAKKRKERSKNNERKAKASPFLLWFSLTRLTLPKKKNTIHRNNGLHSTIQLSLVMLLSPHLNLHQSFRNFSYVAKLRFLKG